jgi:subtilase family serine protease
MRPWWTYTSSLAAAVAAVLLVLTASGGLTGPADAAVGSHRVGVAPTLPRGAHQLGTLASGAEIPVDITLNPRDPSGLAAFAQAVSTPGSAEDRHYLTVAQFRQEFAPTDAQIASVRAGLESAGLDPGAVSANGLLIQLSATAAQLSAAFSTSFDTVELPDGRAAYANTSAPQLSSALAGVVQGVIGLDDLTVPHALGFAPDTAAPHVPISSWRSAEATSSPPTDTAAVTPCAAATNAIGTHGGGYTADEIASAYGLTSLYAEGDEGAGQTVALMEFEPFSLSDVAAYNACYDIDGGSTSDVSTISVTAGDQAGAGSGAGSGEAALDIEQVLGLAPDATVAVFESPNSDAGDIDGYTAMVDSSAKVISTSWGECEPLAGPSALDAENTIFEQAATEGISVYAAAGDSGSTDCDDDSRRSDPTLAVDDPASQPDVTSVGGTSLASPADQSVWNDSGDQGGAGGGGVSTQWAMPSYQSGAPGDLGVVNPLSSTTACQAAGAYCREVPDVSADADPGTGYVIDYDGAWELAGGTSAAAPLWAAMTALANASSFCASTPVGFANPVLYAIAGNAGEYASDFTDVTSGNNDYTPSGNTSGTYPATTGYDMASGLGAPDGAALVPDMCGEAAALDTQSPPDTTTATTTTPTSGAPTPTPTASAPSTTTTATATSPTATTAATAASSQSSSSGGGTSSAGSAGSRPTTTRDCTVTTSLRRAGSRLAVSRSHPSATLSIPLDLPGGCGSYTLSLARHVTTTEPPAAKVLDTLEVQLLSRSDRLLSTLTTLSNRNARTGYQTLRVDLTRYAGRRLILRFLAARTGPRATTFTLRSVTVRRS